jgi:cell division transport system permease protein
VGAVLVAVATQAALAENLSVIRTLRQIGARDSFIARAFVRRMTLRTAGGAVPGALAGAVVLAMVPTAPGGLLDGVAPAGADWLWTLAVPVVAAVVAFVAARVTAFRLLRRVP